MVNDPIVEGPITGPGVPFLVNTSSDQALAAAGYEAKEYFVSGTATSYRGVNDLPANGMWEVEPAGSAPYKTRIMVYRPADMNRFNGTVVMEWLNVSGGIEAGPGWTLTHTELMRRGYAWIGVSAQRGGVEGNPATSLGLIQMDLKTVDAQRYGSLSHPGDDYSYDIYSQVAKAIRHPGRVNPLAGCRVEQILAQGQSQSALQLTTYINAIQPLVKLFDGFLVHGRFGFAALSGFSPSEGNSVDVNGANFASLAPVFIRTDINVPVLILESETDLIILCYYKARQDDTDRIRLWEVAGTAHADLYTFRGTEDTGKDPSFAKVVELKSPYPGFIDCELPINAGPQHFITKAAIHQLDKWVRTGVAPKPAPRLEIAGNPPVFVLDALGNVKGGIRTPYVDVPIARLSGLGQPPAKSIMISLCGTTELFDKATLSRLYPDHRTYVAAVGKSTEAAVQAGFLLREDGELIKAAAAASDVGNP